MNREFSIVIPVFNREDLVERTLYSVKAQTYRPIHLIIVDNDSADGSLEVCRRWADDNRSDDFRVTVVEEKKPWATAARNRGLREVEGEYVCFFDSDDIMRPGLAAAAMDAFARNPLAGIVYWKVKAHPDSGADFTMKTCRPPFLMWNHLIHNVLRPPGSAMRTSLVRSAGGWNERLPLWDDMELGIRLLLLNPVCVYIPETFADVYPQREGMTGTSMSAKAGKWELALDAAEQAIRRAGRKNLLDIIDYRRMVLAAIYAREGNTEAADRLRSSMSRPSLPLRFVYTYTRRGFRGASYWYFLLR